MQGGTFMSVSLTDVNRALRQNPAAAAKSTDAAFLSRLREIALSILREREARPIVLLSGPSGSGKTTSALLLERFMDAAGVETHTLSLDNYFRTLTEEEKALFSKGKLDLEAPTRIDGAFLTEQLDAIYRCEPVQLPVYDFRASRRTFPGKTLCRNPGELVILEGIHSLNPAVIQIPDEKTVRIYVSVRTRLTLGTRVLHPSRIRLMRRLVRDKLYRSRSFHDTLMMFPSVEAGENKYIMPYKHRSSFDVDTFHDYEICAYRPFLRESLRTLPPSPLIEELLTFLDASEILSAAHIPSDSLIREFIGNGHFS